MTLVQAGGRNIFFDDLGSGPPLLMIAGHMVARTTWAAQVADFAPHLRVVTLDNRDAGESDPEQTPYTIADMAGDAAALLDTLGIARAHVLGHSMGVSIALSLALDYPERVDHLILASGRAADPPPPGGRTITPPARATWIADPVERARARTAAVCAPGFFDTRPELLTALVEQERGNRITYEGVVRQIAAMRDTAHRPRLREIAVPTLVLHGDADPLVAVQHADTLAAGIPGAHKRIFAGVGHRPHIERTEEFNEAVREFLGIGQ